MRFYQLAPVCEFLVTEAVSFTRLVERNQAVLNRTHNLSLAADDPTFGVCRRQLGKRII